MSKTEIFLKKSPIYYALSLEAHFSAKKRRQVINITKYVLYSIPIVIILSIIFSNYINPVSNDIPDILISKLIGIAMVFTSIYLLMNVFEMYFASVFYFEYIAKNNYKSDDLYTFSAGRILRRVRNDNILTGLLRSQGVGKEIFRRLGITKAESDLLLMKQAEIKNPPLLNLENIPLI